MDGWVGDNSQPRDLNPQRPRRRTSPINQNCAERLSRHLLRLCRQQPLHRQPHRVKQPLPHRHRTHSQRRRLLIAHPIRNPHLHVRLDGDVFCEGAVFRLGEVAPVREAADALVEGPGFAVAGAEGRDAAGVVAAAEGAGGVDVIDVFPVGGVEGDGGDFDEEVARAEGGDGAVGYKGGVAEALEDDGFLVRHGGIGLVGWGGC
jgi:hypothetical protein